MKAYFQQFAAYNRWANARLYEAAMRLDEADYHRNVGAFFKSMCGTLNHLLVADRIWMKRFTGEGDHPGRLDAIIHEDRAALALARAEEDDRIARFIDAQDEAAFDRLIHYKTISGGGLSIEQKLGNALAHFFNHQTHHRGQAHAILSILTGEEPPSFDMLLLQRGMVAAPDLRRLAQSSASG